MRGQLGELANEDGEITWESILEASDATEDQLEVESQVLNDALEVIENNPVKATYLSLMWHTQDAVYAENLSQYFEYLSALEGGPNENGTLDDLEVVKKEEEEKDGS
jgi:hypothetical protein